MRCGDVKILPLVLCTLQVAQVIFHLHCKNHPCEKQLELTFHWAWKYNFWGNWDKILYFYLIWIDIFVLLTERLLPQTVLECNQGHVEWPKDQAQKEGCSGICFLSTSGKFDLLYSGFQKNGLKETHFLLSFFFSSPFWEKIRSWTVGVLCCIEI